MSKRTDILSAYTKQSLFVSRICYGFIALILSMPMAASANAFTTPLFNCPSAIDTKSLSACASANQDKLTHQKPEVPYAHTDSATIYALLGNLPQGHPATDEPIATRRLRSSIGEWLYFSIPEPDPDLEPHDSYEDLCTDCMNALEVYKRADGRYLLFFWDYLAASNSISHAYMINAAGKLTLLTMQFYDDVNKGLTKRPASFNNYKFDPQTDILTNGISGSASDYYIEIYKLNGELFELQKLTDTITSDSGKEKVKVIYNRKK